MKFSILRAQKTKNYIYSKRLSFQAWVPTCVFGSRLILHITASRIMCHNTECQPRVPDLVEIGSQPISEQNSLPCGRCTKRATLLE